MEFISAILAIIKAVPIIDSWFKELVMTYGKWKLESFDKEFTKAWIVMVRDNDQRMIEEVLGMNPGPSPDQTDVVRRRRGEDRP